ncbi:MAG: hypothetical protein PWP23_1488 [Candidatus Sumerlaeota bacterium]|nr:hypothetical protein [Candidatus Sumerlaeota bacterium]
MKLARRPSLLLIPVLWAATLNAQEPASVTVIQPGESVSANDVSTTSALTAQPTEEQAIDEAMALIKADDLDLDARIDAVRTIVERYPHRGEAWAALGELRVEAGSDAPALMAFERAVERNPRLHTAWHWIGILKKRQKTDLPGALDAFRKARDNGGPADVELNEMAVTLAQMGRLKDAYAAWVEAITLDPDWGVLHANALKAAAALGDERAVERHFAGGMAAERFEEQTVLIYGDYLMKKGKEDEAFVAYEAGINRDPDSYRLRYYYANALQQEGEKESALEQYKAALLGAEKAADRDTASVVRKSIFAIEYPRDLRNLVEAEKLVYEIGNDPEKGRKKLEKAVKILNPFIEKHPDLWEALLLRGMARRYLGETTQARFDFEKVLEYVPDQPNALINLALVFRDQRNYYFSVEYARRAAEAAPRDPMILANAGFVLLDSDRCDEASEMLARADALIPDDVEGDPLGPLAEEIATRCNR